MLPEYDKALENKIKSVFPRVVYSPVDQFYSRYLMHTDNRKPVELPAISFWRVPKIEVNNYNAKSQLRTPNIVMNNPEDDNNFKVVSTIETNIDYNLEIWTQNQISAYEMLHELLYYFHVYPILTVQYEGINFRFDLELEEAQDNTDISTFENNAEIWRITLPIHIEKARLFYTSNIKKFKYIGLTVEAVNEFEVSKEGN